MEESERERMREERSGIEGITTACDNGARERLIGRMKKDVEGRE